MKKQMSKSRYMKIAVATGLMVLTSAFFSPVFLKKDGVLTESPVILVIDSNNVDKRIRIVFYEGVKYHFLREGKCVRLLKTDSLDNE